MLIIKDLGAEFGESPQLFGSWSRYDDFLSLLNPQERNEYPYPETVSLSDTIDWLRNCNQNYVRFILRNACLSERDFNRIKRGLQ